MPSITHGDPRGVVNKSSKISTAWNVLMYSNFPFYDIVFYVDFPRVSR